MATGRDRAVALTVDGRAVQVEDRSQSLLDALRYDLGLTGAKDGCSPQGQCGCCTVLVDGAPRVACVTPLRRVGDRAVTTIDGLADAEKWAEAFRTAGASQCGFCTPGIIVRLAAARNRSADTGQAESALLAHLCRCTGWRTILDAWSRYGEAAPPFDRARASARATLEGGVTQEVSTAVALGRGGFAADTAPAGALVAVSDGTGGWAVGETLDEARQVAGKVQGRRTTEPAVPPLEVPPGEWARTLRTCWTEPGYLETDASWCEPGGTPASPLANGGAFGAKASSPVAATARALADEHGRPVLVLWSREDTVRWGPKRPPVAVGADAGGEGVMRVAATDGLAEAADRLAGGFDVRPIEVPGPPTSLAIRGALWIEASVVRAAATGATTIADPVTGAVAEANVAADGTVAVRVAAGDPLDEVVLRSYVIGAAHQALSWVTSEAIAVGPDGDVADLTIRSFGIARAVDTPPIEVEIDPAGEPRRAGDAVMAAVALAVWRHQGFPPVWPTGTPLRSAR